ncbi:MAG: type II toxin-antitoxin system Phd/YefM family antitoxin [Candidatus Promineofilum sp.]|nr:type II toxin-antitoxin system Phd/YefM family antitoxin [Promineifilum sp.]
MANQTIITASDLQRASGSVLKRVALGGEHLIIERAGYPVAVILSYPEYEALMRERALTGHRELVIAMSQEAERQGLTEEQLMAELKEVKRQVFEETYGRRPG